MIVGITRTFLAFAVAMKLSHGSSERLPLSTIVPSFFSVYTKGLTSVSISRCGNTSLVLEDERQYGIQPVTSKDVAAAAYVGKNAESGIEIRSTSILMRKNFIALILT